MTYPLPNKYHDIIDDIEQLAQTISQIDTNVSNLEAKTAATSEIVGDVEDTLIHTDQITNGEITNIAPNRFLIVNDDGNGFTCVDGGGTSGGKTGQCTIKRTDEDYDTIYGDIWSVSRDGTIPQMNSEKGCANCLDIFCDESEIENAEQFPKVNSKTMQSTQDFEAESNSSIILKNEIEQEEDVVELATNQNYGLIKVGTGIDVSNGIILTDIITAANKNHLGYVKVGGGIDVEDGVISVAEIDVATNSTKGVIKIGEDFELNSDGEMELKDMADASIIYKLDQIKQCENGNVDLEERKLIYRLLVTSDLAIQINENFVPTQDYTFILELISDGTHLVAFLDQFKDGMTELPINRGTTKLKISKKLGAPYYEAEISRLDTSDPVLLTANADVRSKFLMTAPKGGNWYSPDLLRDYYNGFSDIKELYFEFFTLVCVDYVKYWSRSSSVAMNEFIFEGSNDGKNWTTLIHKENEVCYGKVYTERKGCFRYYKLTIGYTGDDNKPGGVMLFGTEIDNNECEITNLTPRMASNITPYATLTASSMTSGSAANLTDINLTTYIRVTSSNNSRWIKYELAEASIANLLELHLSSTNTQSNWFKLEGSNDNETWDLLLERQYPTNSLFNNGYRVAFYHIMNETAYKYYRLTCLATNDSSDNWDLFGFMLYRRDTGKHHFYRAVPKLSSVEQDGYIASSSSVSVDTRSPYHAFDDDTGTAWVSAESSNITDHWIQIKFPTATSCNAVSMQPRNDEYYNQAPTSFEVQGSNDGENFVTIKTFTGLTWTQTEKKILEFDNGSAYLYYRVNSLSVQNNSTRFALSELNFGIRIREYKRYLEKYEYLVPAMSSNSQNGYVASADSTYGSDYPARKAFDRSNSSSWTSRDATSTTPHWLKIYNNNGISANCINIMWHSTHYGIDYVISGSNDDETYTDLVTITNNNYLNPSYYLGDIQTFKYWKIYITRINTNVTRTEIHQFNLIKQTIVQEY